MVKIFIPVIASILVALLLGNTGCDINGYMAAANMVSPIEGEMPVTEAMVRDDQEAPGTDEVEYVYRYEEIVKEVIVEKPVELREYASVNELKTWLREDDTDEYVFVFAGEDGICCPSDKYDCDDYAFQLQRRAASSGYLMSATIIARDNEPHIINMCSIGNDIYYIEPQSDDVWLYCHRD